MHSLSSTKRSLIAIILILSAAGWISFSLRDSTGYLKTSLQTLELQYLALSLIPAVLMVFITSYVYFLILAGFVPSIPPPRNVMVPFITSQVVRYLPGRLWGIVYQVQVRDNSVQTRSVVKANVVQFALFSLNSIAVAVSAYVYYDKGIVIGLITFAALMMLIFLVLRTSLLQRIASLMTRIAISEEQSRFVNNKDLLILGLLQLEWFLYFMACALILPGHVNFTDILIIASNYVVAWVVGIITTVLPSGLIVREASFIWLSSLFGFDPTDMFAFSIVARVIFTLADIVSATLGLALLREGRIVEE